MFLSAGTWECWAGSLAWRSVLPCWSDLNWEGCSGSGHCVGLCPLKDGPLETGNIYNYWPNCICGPPTAAVSSSVRVCVFYLTGRPASSWVWGGWWSLPCWRWTSVDEQTERQIFVKVYLEDINTVYRNIKHSSKFLESFQDFRSYLQTVATITDSWSSSKITVQNATQSNPNLSTVPQFQYLTNASDIIWNS